MKTYLSIFTFLFLSFAFAQESPMTSFLGVQKAEIPIKGMTCMSCVGTIKRELKKFEGIEELNISLPEQKASITYFPTKIELSEIVKKLNEIGYETGEIKKE